MKNKGFTLIELLAVIIILGILLLIAIPSVTQYINNSRKQSYVGSAKELLRGAGNLVNSGELDITDPNVTYYIPSTCIPTEQGARSPYGKFNPAYVIVTFSGENYNYYWTSTDEQNIGVPKPVFGSDLSIEHIETDVETVSTDYGIGERDKIQLFNADCSESTMKNPIGKYHEDDLTSRPVPVRNCEFSGNMVQGAQFIDGQYTYRYKQEYYGSNWGNIAEDGWGVTLTNKGSEDDVTTKLCTTINGKPIVSMKYMFYNSRASVFDVSSFDTSKVTDMSFMFYQAGYQKPDTRIIDVEYFDTSSVDDMQLMFANFAINSSYVSYNFNRWNVSKVNSTADMFMNFGTNATEKVELSLDNWNLESAKYIYYTFLNVGRNGQGVDIQASGWNLPVLTSVESVFTSVGANGSGPVNITAPNWDIPSATSVTYLASTVGQSSGQDITFNLEKWNIPSATKFVSSFGGFGADANVIKIYMKEWKVNSITDLSSLFYSCFSGSAGVDLDLSYWKLSSISSFSSSTFGGISGVSNYLNLNLSHWEMDNMYNISDLFRISGSGTTDFKVDISYWKFPRVRSFNYSFGYLGNSAQNLTFDVTGMDVSRVTSFYEAFYITGAKVQTNLVGIETWDTSSVTDLSYMFNFFASSSTGTFTLDLSSWDVSHVTTTSSMFRCCGRSASTVRVNLKNWNLNSLYYTSDMFAYAFESRGNDVEVDTSGWTFNNKSSLDNVFGYMGTSSGRVYINASNWKIPRVTSLNGVFSSAPCASEKLTIDVSNWNTSSVTYMSQTFRRVGMGCGDVELIGLSTWNLSNVRSMISVFENAQKIVFDNFRINATNIDYLFAGSAYMKGTIVFTNAPTSYASVAGIGNPNDYVLTVNYTSNATNIDTIISAISNGNPNVRKGVQVA